MTRNHESQPYALAHVAKAHGAVARQGPTEWARSLHARWTAGEMGPKNAPGDAEKTTAKVRQTMKPELVATALRTIVRGENELRLRAVIRATRLLDASKDPKDKAMSAAMAKALELAWGIKRAYETVSEGDAELYDQLRDQWGEVQLPPAGATVNLYAADELLIAAAVRRLG